MAGKAKAKEDLAKAGVEVTEGMLKSLLKKAKEAVRKGANSSKVEKIVESAGNGKSAYLKAEKKVLDVLTGTKRSDTGAVLGKTKKVTLKDGTTINVKKDFRSNKDVEAGTGRRILKGAIRTSPLTGTGVAVGISATKRKKAEDARKAAASEKNRKRSDAAEEEYKSTRGGAAKRQAARDKKAAAATTKKKSGTTKTTTKGKGKLFPKFRPFGGVLARALLGDDENFGGERGAIDFIRTKKKPVKKNMGGMMKRTSAPASVRTPRPGDRPPLDKKNIHEKIKQTDTIKKAPPQKVTGSDKKRTRRGPSRQDRLKNSPIINYDDTMPVKKTLPKVMREKPEIYKRTPDEIYKRTPDIVMSDPLPGRRKSLPSKNMGGMMKKKGYAKGGAAKKTASRGKARGVGAATRGFGRAMKK